MGTKTKFPEDILQSKINDININYANEFFEVVKKSNYSQKSKTDYIQAVDRLFKYTKNWNISFKDYTKDIYDDYRQELMLCEIGQDRINTTTAALNKMSNYFKDTYPKEFDRNFLKKIDRIANDETKFPSGALKLNELEEFKNYLRDGNSRREYTFMVIYHSDIKKGQLGIFDPKNINWESGYFEKGDEKVEITDDLKYIIEKANINKFSFFFADHYCEEMTDFLQEKGFYEANHNFTFDDIRKTRKKFFKECPFCGRMVENISTNWVLVQVEDKNGNKLYENMYLACKYCKGVESNE